MQSYHINRRAFPSLSPDLDSFPCTLPPPTALIPHSPRPRERILGEGPRKSLLAANLLAANETVNCDGDGAVDVTAAAVFGQAHLRKRLADAEDGLEVTDLRQC